MNRFMNLHAAFGLKSFVAAAIMVSLFAMSGHFAPVNGQSACDLGERWDESEAEGSYDGIWIRQGKSNNFEATFRSKGGHTIKSGLSMYLSNGQRKVTIKRSDASENMYRVFRCWYEGQIASDGVSVSGTYSCTREDGTKTGTYNWSAKINCGKTKKVNNVEINRLRQWVAYYQNLINQWTQYRDQKVRPYYNDPKYYQWARAEYQKANQAIASSQQYMAHYENQLRQAGAQ